MTPSLQAHFWRFVMKNAFRGQALGVAELRARDAKNAHWMNRLPPDLTLEKMELDGLSATWLRPAPGVERVMLYLHGGGFVTGGMASHQTLCGQLARRLEMSLLVPDYRLAPENPFPAALEDALAAYRWLLAQGWQAENIFVGGDSAGGGLAVATVLALRDANTPLPAAVICLSPWVDLTCSGMSHQTRAKQEVLLSTAGLREWGALYCGAESASNPQISPLFAQFHDFPPLLIQVGSEEILLDDARALAEKARAAGVNVTLEIWNGMWHVWPILADLIPEGEQAFQHIKHFIHTLTHPTSFSLKE